MNTLLIAFILFLLAIQNLLLGIMIYKISRKIDDFESSTIRFHFKDREIQAERYYIISGQIEEYAKKNHKILQSLVRAFKKGKI